MWRKETKEYEIKNMHNIIEFTGNHSLYGQYMLQAANNWEYSTEHFLSNTSINRKAYIGHSACCIYKGYPEYLVRQAWWELTEHQRTLADAEALKVIKQWEQKKISEIISKRGKKDATKMGFQMKFHWS